MTISVADFSNLLQYPETLRRAIELTNIAQQGTYQAFVDRLYTDLDTSIHELQGNPELLQKDSEDRLTYDLLIQLKRIGYHAQHDPKRGGHVDLAVSLGQFSWIGEAKKDGAFSRGFLQLLTRYVPASGNPAHNAGGLLNYLVGTPNAAKTLAEWRTAVEAFGGQDIRDCPSNPLAFFSTHIHKGSGLPFYVRSVCVSLYRQPEDKAAEQKAARAVAKAQKDASNRAPKATK